MIQDVNVKALKKNAFRYSKVRGETESRVRVPGGLVSAKSMARIVEIAEEFGNHEIFPNNRHVKVAFTGCSNDCAHVALNDFGIIGMGAQQPTAEWGAMVSTGRNYILDQWWYSCFPGMAILVTATGFNLFGDGLRDILDPKQKAK